MLTVGLISAGLYLLLLLLKAYLSLRYATQMNQNIIAFREPLNLTILQPILSGDPLLESCLVHNLKTVSKEVQFIYLIDEDDGVALELTKRLAEAYSSVKLVVCPSVPQNLNPKVFKLAYGFPYVTTSLLAVLDDDTCLSADSLQQAQKYLNDAELYTGLPHYAPGKNFWSSLLAHFVNNNSVLTYLPILAFTRAFSLNGMFYVLKRETLVNIGGFEAVQHQLTDDYAVAKLIREHRGTIVQGITTQSVQTTVKDFRHYVRLMHRWFLFASWQINEQKNRLKVLLLVFLVVPTLLFFLSLVSLLTSSLGIGVLLVVMLIRFLILKNIQEKILGYTVGFSFILSTLSECLQPFHMLHAVLIKQITWRKRRIGIEPDGRFSYLEDVP